MRLPCGSVVGAAVMSFYNIPNAHHLYMALQNFQLLVGTLVMYWLVVQNVRSEQDLRRVLGFQLLSTVFICAGLAFIKGERKLAHTTCMVIALVTSTAFLACYLTYHYLKAGHVTHFTHPGWPKTLYFVILGSHTPLAVFVLPMFFFTPDSAGAARMPLWAAAKEGGTSLLSTLRKIRHFKNGLTYLLAFMLYNDGLASIIAFC